MTPRTSKETGKVGSFIRSRHKQQRGSSRKQQERPLNIGPTSSVEQLITAASNGVPDCEYQREESDEWKRLQTDDGSTTEPSKPRREHALPFDEDNDDDDDDDILLAPNFGAAPKERRLTAAAHESKNSNSKDKRKETGVKSWESCKERPDLSFQINREQPVDQGNSTKKRRTRPSREMNEQGKTKSNSSKILVSDTPEITNKSKEQERLHENTCPPSSGTKQKTKLPASDSNSDCSIDIDKTSKVKPATTTENNTKSLGEPHSDTASTGSSGGSTTIEEDESSGHWSCAKCTLKNDDRFRRCNACGERRPVEIKGDVGSIMSQRSTNTNKQSPRGRTRQTAKGSENNRPLGNEVRKSKVSSSGRYTYDTSKSPDGSKRLRSTSQRKRAQSPKRKKFKTKQESTKTEKSTPAQFQKKDTEQAHTDGPENSNMTLVENKSPRKGDSEDADQTAEDNCTDDNCRIDSSIPGIESETRTTVPTSDMNRKDSFERRSQSSIEPVPPRNPNDVRAIESLQAENQSLREQVKSLEMKLVQLQSMQRTTPVISNQISRFVAKRLFEEFAAKNAEALRAVKEAFLRDQFSMDETCRDTEIGIHDNSTNFGPDGASPMRNFSVSEMDDDTPPQEDESQTKFSGERISQTVNIRSNVQNQPQAPDTTITVPKTIGVIAGPGISSTFERKDDVVRLLPVESLVGSTSPCGKGASYTRSGHPQTPNRKSGPSQTEIEHEAMVEHESPLYSIAPPSPAHSTQTIDPTSVTRSEKEQELAAIQSPLSMQSLKSKTSSKGLPSCVSIAQKTAPASPAGSTQTMDPSEQAQSYNQPQKRTLAKSPSQTSCSQEKSAQKAFVLASKQSSPTSLVDSQCPPSTLESKTLERRSEKMLRHDTLNLPESKGGHVVTARTNPSAAFQKTTEAGATDIEQCNAFTEVIHPAGRQKNPPLGNSTNKKASFGWTNTTNSKSFLNHLMRTSGRTNGDKKRISAPWVSASRPTKTANKTSPSLRNIWDDSQDLNPGYQYQEVVRCKAKRQGLPCHDCPDCRAFYDFLHRSGHDFSQDVGLMEYSRHRAQFTPPETPADFWEIDFTDEKKETKSLAVGGSQGEKLP